ncbi:hypothetical protein ABZ682_22750 [Streptomyces griseoviridis]|uniref:hypothetical protein n=1 Tax=Streptomyces griseoviridis TaxID=45398 RepID=UPI003404EF89
MQHHASPILDEYWQGFELARDDTHRYLWIWMGWNIRLIAVARHDVTEYDHGWCYRRDPEMVAAAVAAWDSDTQDEPTGWHKRPTWPIRQAPRRDEAPHYNRPRCEHGSYFVDDGCRVLNCRDLLRHEKRTAAATPQGER